MQINMQTGKETPSRLIRFLAVTAIAVLLTVLGAHLSLLLRTAPAVAHAAAATTDVAVAPQYDTTHLYLAPQDVDRFVASFLATFGGTATKSAVMTITPTPSSTVFRAVSTPVGILSVFGFQTPVPYPFGAERTGYLVSDMDTAIRAARASGADVLVTSFNDPIGRDTIVQWPGGVNMQFYWHTTPPSSPPLQTIPENRVYVSADRANEFVRGFVAFSHGKVISDDAHAPGVEIGRPADTYRRIRIQSNFGKLTALVTDGHLPFPYGREMTGYEIANLSDTLAKAKAAGVAVVVAPYTADQRSAAFVQFPGGYIAEIHALIGKSSASRTGAWPVDAEAQYASNTRYGIEQAIGEIPAASRVWQ